MNPQQGMATIVFAGLCVIVILANWVVLSARSNPTNRNIANWRLFDVSKDISYIELLEVKNGYVDNYGAV